MTAPAYSDPGATARPLGELFSDMTSQVQDLLRKEVELVKLETNDQMAKATKAGAMLGAAVGRSSNFFAALLLSFAAAWGLADAIPTGLAFLAVGLLYAVVGGLLFTQGRRKLASFKPVPEQTMRMLRDDVALSVGGQGIALPRCVLHSVAPDGEELECRVGHQRRLDRDQRQLPSLHDLHLRLHVLCCSCYHLAVTQLGRRTEEC